jgi:hypothetical protein
MKSRTNCQKEFELTSEWSNSSPFCKPSPVRVCERLLDVKYQPLKSTGQSSAEVRTQLAPFLAHESTAITLTHAQITRVLDLVPASSDNGEAKLRELNEWTQWHDTSIELHAVRDGMKLDEMGTKPLLRSWSKLPDGLLSGTKVEMDFLERYLDLPHEKMANSMKASPPPV